MGSSSTRTANVALSGQDGTTTSVASRATYQWLKRWRAALAGFWRQSNAVDRLYFGYFGVIGLLAAALHERVPGWPVYLGISGLVMAWISGLIASARRSRVGAFLHDWYPLLVFIICFEEIARLSFLFASGWRDSWLLWFEARVFPVEPTAWLGSIRSRPLTELFELGYFSYFLLLMIVGGVLYKRTNKGPFRQVMTASVTSYFICYAVYLAFPTEGPAHTLAAVQTKAIQAGPFHWAVLMIQRYGGVHGNAFPSSHVAAGVVPLVFAWRYSPRLAAWLTPLVVLLCFGAVYDGYHYASDVIAGAAIGAVVAGLVMMRAISNGN